MGKSLQKLINTDKAFSELSVKTGAARAFSQFLVKNALMLPQNKQPVLGIKKIYKSMSKSGPKDVLSWRPEGGKIAKSGDLGYTWGLYSLQLTNGTKIEGKYLNIWVRQKDGSWKVEIDMGNTNGS